MNGKRIAATGVTTALIYTRVSSDEQAREGVSLDAQLAECRRYAAQRGWALGEEYQDVLSGKRDDRPAYQRLLADVRRQRGEGKALVVVVAALDRLGRRILERVRSREELQALGVQTHSVREGGEVSDLTANVLAAVAEEETRRMGERVSASWKHIRSQGWAKVGHAPWGYRWREATPEERSQAAPRLVLDVDSEIAPYVREAFARVADGESVRSVSRWVSGLPESIRGGRSMPLAAVRFILSQPIYAPEGARRWPALVDSSVWDRAQDQIARHRSLPRQASGRHLLSGLLRCPMCGGRMHGAVRKHRSPRYTCGQRNQNSLCQYAVLIAPLDRAVLEQVSRALDAFGERGLRPALERAWDALRQPVGEDQARRAHLAAQRDRATKRLGDAAIAMLDGALDRAGYEAAKGRIEADLAAVEMELARLGDLTPAVLPPLEEALALVGTWGAALAAADVPSQREVLATLIERIAPVRVRRGDYTAVVTWTPLGRALAEIAGALE